jgi:hypothetical protein
LRRSVGSGERKGQKLVGTAIRPNLLAPVAESASKSQHRMVDVDGRWLPAIRRGQVDAVSPRAGGHPLHLQKASGPSSSPRLVETQKGRSPGSEVRNHPPVFGRRSGLR